MTAPVIIDCFSCGRAMTYRGRNPDGTAGRICSVRCRDWFDAGNPPYATPDGRSTFTTLWSRHIAGPSPGHVAAPMRPMGGLSEPGRGFSIACTGCGKPFESTGLRCCSTDCERRLRERKANLADMVDAPAEKRRCEQCQKPLPRWLNGKSFTRRFCPGGKCSRRAREANGKNVGFEAAETPVSQALRAAPDAKVGLA
jgi:hypothetical protein